MKTEEPRLRITLHCPLSISVNWSQIASHCERKGQALSLIVRFGHGSHGCIPDRWLGGRTNPSQWYVVERELPTLIGIWPPESHWRHSLHTKNHPGERPAGGHEL